MLHSYSRKEWADNGLKTYQTYRSGMVRSDHRMQEKPTKSQSLVWAARHNGQGALLPYTVAAAEGISNPPKTSHRSMPGKAGGCLSGHSGRAFPRRIHNVLSPHRRGQGLPSVWTSMGFIWKSSQICSKSCWDHVRRSFRNIKVLSDHRPYRYAPLHRWTYGNHPEYLPDGPLCKCTLSFLWQEIRPAESIASWASLRKQWITRITTRNCWKTIC